MFCHRYAHFVGSIVSTFMIVIGSLCHVGLLILRKCVKEGHYAVVRMRKRGIQW